MKRALLVVLLAACGPRDIVVVDLPDGGGFVMQGKACSDADDCKPDEFCAKDSCAAATGRCAHRANACSDALAVVCGCNGVSYWNDCLRTRAGVEAATPGQCAAPTTCTAAAQCGDPEASCARLLPTPATSCAVVPTGVCWVVPRMCPNTGEPHESCGGGPAVCGGLCQAIRSEQVRRPVNVCP